MKKIEGVDSIEVSLNSGLVRVTFKPENRVTVEQVRLAIRANGFTPKAAEVRIEGRVLEQEGKLVLVVPGHDHPYVLVDHTETPGATQRLRGEGEGLGKTVVIEGVVPETPKRSPVVSIQVRHHAPGAPPP